MTVQKRPNRLQGKHVAETVVPSLCVEHDGDPSGSNLPLQASPSLVGQTPRGFKYLRLKNGNAPGSNLLLQANSCPVESDPSMKYLKPSQLGGKHSLHFRLHFASLRSEDSQFCDFDSS